MRLSFAVPTLAGLLLGWAALAQADSPPAAPIFYCPTPGKAGPAPAATPAVQPTAHQSCPVIRRVATHHHWRGHAAARKVVASNDVSASQAFIYRYERAVHGLDAGAAHQAWAEGQSPCPPHRDHCPAGAPPHAMARAAPPTPAPAAPGPALAQRASPPPPCPHHCPGPDAWRHQGPPRGALAERGPPPPAMTRPMPPPPVTRPSPPPPMAVRPSPPPPIQPRPAPPMMAQRPPPPAPVPQPRPSVHAYAWNGGHSGYGYSESVTESQREGGWSYSEVDGQRRYHHWGDQLAGQPGWGGGGQWGGHPHWRPCPPPVPAETCAASHRPPPQQVYETAGRDAAGYLTWPGKTPAW